MEAIVKLAERDGYLSVDNDGRVAFILAQQGPATVFTLTIHGDLIALRERAGQQRYLVPAVHGVSMASLPQQWNTQSAHDGTVVLLADSACYLACDANGVISFVANAEQACKLLIQEYTERPTWLLRPRDALEAHETQQLRELLAAERAALAAHAQQIDVLQQKQVQVGSGTSAYSPQGHYMLSGNGVREFRQVVSFARPFASIPTVAVAVSCLDVDCHQNTRVDLRAESTTLTDFTLVITTWARTCLYMVKFNYVATNY